MKINNISKHHPDLLNPFLLLKSSFWGQAGYDCSWWLEASNAVTWKQKMQPQSPKAILMFSYDLPWTPIMWHSYWVPKNTHAAHLCHSAQVPPFQKQLGLPKHVVSTCNHFRFPTFQEGWWWLPHDPSHKGIGLLDHCVFPCGWCLNQKWFLCHVDLSNVSAVFLINRANRYNY